MKITWKWKKNQNKKADTHAHSFTMRTKRHLGVWPWTGEELATIIFSWAAKVSAAVIKAEAEDGQIRGALGISSCLITALMRNFALGTLEQPCSHPCSACVWSLIRGSEPLSRGFGPVTAVRTGTDVSADTPHGRRDPSEPTPKCHYRLHRSNQAQLRPSCWRQRNHAWIVINLNLN